MKQRGILSDQFLAEDDREVEDDEGWRRSRKRQAGSSSKSPAKPVIVDLDEISSDYQDSNEEDARREEQRKKSTCVAGSSSAAAVSSRPLIGSFESLSIASSSVTNVHAAPDMASMIKTMWSAAKVRTWLSDVEPDFIVRGYTRTFHEKGIDGKALLALTEQDLKLRLGVENDEHRHVIMVAIQHLSK